MRFFRFNPSRPYHISAKSAAATAPSTWTYSIVPVCPVRLRFPRNISSLVPKSEIRARGLMHQSGSWTARGVNAKQGDPRERSILPVQKHVRALQVQVEDRVRVLSDQHTRTCASLCCTDEKGEPLYHVSEQL